MVSLAATATLPAGSLLDRPTLSIIVPPPKSFVRFQVFRGSIAAMTETRIAGDRLPLAVGECRAADPVVWCISPDSWLGSSTQSAGTVLCQMVLAALAPHFASVIDLSDSLVTFELEGSAARDLLARGTAIDLSRSHFSPGRCARTRFAQLPVLLRPVAAERFELVVDRAPARWLADWLLDAALAL